MDVTELNFDLFQDLDQVLTDVSKTFNHQECLIISRYILSIRKECLKHNPNYQMPKYLLAALDKLKQRMQS